MKKALTLILTVVGAVIVMSSVAMAQLDQNVIQVNANVEKYAKITVISQPMNFGTFTGLPDEEIIAVDNAILGVETNCLLDLLFTAGDLTKGTSTIKTAYKVMQDGTNLGWLKREWPGYTLVGDISKPGGQLATTIRDYQFTGFAKLGPNISSQEAGNYSATITLTVSAP